MISDCVPELLGPLKDGANCTFYTFYFYQYRVSNRVILPLARSLASLAMSAVSCIGLDPITERKCPLPLVIIQHLCLTSIF